MLYKRENSKYYYVKLKHRGRVIRRSTGATTKRDAQRVQEQWRLELQRVRTQSGHTFADAAKRWVREKQKKRSIETDVIVLSWFAPHLEQLYLSEITRDKIDELRALLSKDHAETSVNRYFQVLRALLNKAHKDWEWLKNPPPHVPMYEKDTDREPRFLTWDEWKSLESELPSHLKVAAWFAISTGLRTAPIQKLEWDWISQDGVRFPPKVMKNKSWLTIPLSAVAWQVLAESHQEYGSTGNVFASPAGNPWRGKFTTKAWRKAAIRAGLEGVTFHDLRHTWASWMLQRGVPEHVVMELGGWKDRRTFRDNYGKFSTESLERLAQYV